MSMHMFQMMMKEWFSLPEDERDVCAPLWIHYSQFRCLSHLLRYLTPRPRPHAPIAIETPTQLSDASPWLNKVIFTQRRPLIGSQ